MISQESGRQNDILEDYSSKYAQSEKLWTGVRNILELNSWANRPRIREWEKSFK